MLLFLSFSISSLSNKSSLFNKFSLNFRHCIEFNKHSFVNFFWWVICRNFFDCSMIKYNFSKISLLRYSFIFSSSIIPWFSDIFFKVLFMKY